MRVRVIDRLPGVTARIKDNAVARLRNALSERDFVRACGYFGQQLCITGRQARQVTVVRLGNDQHMNWGLRIDVAKCKRAFCFKQTLSRNLASHDSAE